MDKAIEHIGEEIPFDFKKHIVISNRVAKELAKEVQIETGLLNNPNYFEVENIEKQENDEEIDNIIDLLYKEYGEDDVYITVCDNRFYKAIIMKIDNDIQSCYAELHIHFATTGLANRILYLLKTRIELSLGNAVPWQTTGHKEFCKEIKSFANDCGIKMYKGYRCDYPVFYIANENGKVDSKNFEIFLDALRELNTRYELKEWDVEQYRFLIAHY